MPLSSGPDGSTDMACAEAPAVIAAKLTAAAKINLLIRLLPRLDVTLLVQHGNEGRVKVVSRQRAFAL